MKNYPTLPTPYGNSWFIKLIDKNVTRSWRNKKKYFLLGPEQFRTRIPAANKETTEKAHETRFATTKNLQIKFFWE